MGNPDALDWGEGEKSYKWETLEEIFKYPYMKTKLNHVVEYTIIMAYDCKEMNQTINKINWK